MHTASGGSVVHAHYYSTSVLCTSQRAWSGVQCALCSSGNKMRARVIVLCVRDVCGRFYILLRLGTRVYQVDQRHWNNILCFNYWKLSKADLC